MRLLVAVITCLLWSITGSARLVAQCQNPPTLKIHGDTMAIAGAAVHLHGSLPERSDTWFYHVTCHSSRLFEFSLWKIERFHDRDGFFVAKSWNLEVLDSQEYPEKAVIFDRENQFYFWGDFAKSSNGSKMVVKSIVGLPDGICGDVVLREVPTGR